MVAVLQRTCLSTSSCPGRPPKPKVVTGGGSAAAFGRSRPSATPDAEIEATVKSIVTEQCCMRPPQAKK
jgi:hypothetical protein